MQQLERESDFDIVLFKRAHSDVDTAIITYEFDVFGRCFLTAPRHHERTVFIEVELVTLEFAFQDQDIAIASAAIDEIHTFAGVDHVSPAPAIHHVVATAGVDVIVAPTAEHRIVAAACINDIVAAAAGHRVIAPPSVDLVSAAEAEHGVVPSFGSDLVAENRPKDHIALSRAANLRATEVKKSRKYISEERLPNFRVMIRVLLRRRFEVVKPGRVAKRLVESHRSSFRAIEKIQAPLFSSALDLDELYFWCDAKRFAPQPPLPDGNYSMSAKLI
ncbi:MAG: hypothetical protein AAGM38_04290 [Pseudomonadota bacterium]